ncbi:MAG: acylphosphatase, partial [Pseudomonadota bacterium]
MATRADITLPQRLRIAVRGTVQGVGFRPFVWTLAQDLGLSGWVRNDESGVTIEIEG